MADNPKQLYLPKNSAEARVQLINDFRYAAELTGIDDPPVEPGTDMYALFDTLSKHTMLGVANFSIAQDDSSVLDATGAALDNHRRALGLPEVPPAGSSGKIVVTIAGSTTIGNGTELKLPNGLRIQTVGTYINPADQAELDVTAIDTGALTNLAGGQEVTFVSAPTNVSAKAKVSNSFPLTGGTDAESDERKRDRILNTLRNKPAAGNWAYLRQLVLDNHGFIQDCYVYPAPGGPASQLIVPLRQFDIAQNDYSRAPSSALLQAIRNTIQSDANTGVETVVRAPTEQSVDFSILIEIPESALSGGNGSGWTDPTPWPPLVAGDSNTVAVSSVNADYDVVTVDAQTTTAPVAGQTQIAWWSPADRKFYTALVVTQTGSTGAWVLTLDRPLVGKDGVGIASADWISPNAQNLSAYGDTWVSIFNDLGPGEVTSDVNRLPRSKRHPYTTDEDPSSLTNAILGKVVGKHPEITDIEFGSAATTSPTVPASVADPPAVLIPRRLGIYRAT